MAETYVTCTKCGTKIPLDEALMASIEGKLRKEFESSEAELKQELEKKEEEIKRKQSTLDKTVAKLVADQLKKAEGKIRTQMDEEYSVEIRDLQKNLEEKKEKIKQAEDQELAQRKKVRQLEERERARDLEFERRLSEERKTIEDAVRMQVSEESELKEKEQVEKEATLTRQIEELKRKLQQGSEQLQGEALESLLEETLSHAFAVDTIEQVPKGIKGPDLVHKICKPSGEVCAIIAWEAKRTKEWRNDWIDKLKADLPRLNAHLGIIVTSALPDGIKLFGSIRGIVVTSYEAHIPVATLIRAQLMDLHMMKEAGFDSDDKKDTLYNYLLSPQFRQRVESIADPLVQMKADLDREVRAMEGSWSKRKKQIEMAAIGVAKMFGDMQGIVGNNLQSVSTLALPIPETQPQLNGAPHRKTPEDADGG